MICFYYTKNNWMKKIGIITIVKVNNYGAELQALALQKSYV